MAAAPQKADALAVKGLFRGVPEADFARERRKEGPTLSLRVRYAGRRSFE
jgi:hypothetical protein